MAIDAPDNVIPLADGYGTDPYNEEAVALAMATVREACASKGHRCLIVIDPVDSPYFVGYIGSVEWLHFMGGRIMRLAMDDRADIEAVELDDGADYEQ